jgi:hypothetical protein
MLVKRMAVLLCCLFIASTALGKKKTEGRLLEVAWEGLQDQQVQRIKQYFNGQKIFMSYREGGALYGTYFFQEIHFCPSGQYKLFGQSRKQTVLDNEQINNWEEYGAWDVVSFQGQIVLRFHTTSDEQGSFPIRLLPGGQIWIGDGISIQQQGKAQCW